ncbi:RidA family protein [Paraburkholderia sp. BL21I4N1]|uniref:RidA family protein n=1 Tax=Paraburkholderia sp. BL21I4N1 TaxID=1938801 RepID=UPI000CFDCE9D|nr:RidA family protein [Paraburkholderia sp. BL21I4N1]PQV46645.1 enamine deaminase RidA (YjgF/YER057c/UK114 family) [Paraburkholderia sp. BL21I4N1]
MTIDIPARLAQLGMTLPPAPEPRGAYQGVVIHGGIAYVSGQVSRTADGVIAGPVDRDTPPAVVRHAAQTCVLRALSALVAALPASSAVERVLVLRGFVNAVPRFANHGAVMDEASTVLHDVFGDHGRHARSALGVSSLPGCGLLEIELTVALTHAQQWHDAETQRRP